MKRGTHTTSAWPDTPVEPPSILLVGHASGTHVGASLWRAAVELGVEARLLDTSSVYEAPRWWRALLWRMDRRPARLKYFAESVVEAARTWHPSIVLTTGIAPVRADALRALGQIGIRRLNYSTDDPWNPVHRARWFLEALPHYDVVFTPRAIAHDDFVNAGVKDVRYLPFGYDPRFCVGPQVDACARDQLTCDVLFVGGADADRAPYIEALLDAGIEVAIYGGYWERYSAVRHASRGIVDPEQLRKATLAARIVLVLPRHANRDGHTMRSIEAGAIGACILAEDTPDHRVLYGAGAAYFRTTSEMVERALALLQLPDERRRMAAEARSRIRTAGNTYADRLCVMLQVVQ